MNTDKFDLLESVQPTEGWYAIIGIKDGIAHQRIVPTRAEADEAIVAQARLGRDVYFGVAKYKDGSSRKKPNVRALKSLWIDIDCGEGKPYATQIEGLTALKHLVETVGLPRPIVVNSGRGLHAYWPLTEEVTREEWEPVSIALRDAARLNGVGVDRSCFEAARVLRVPGTFNYKSPLPTEVTVLMGQGFPVPLATMATLLGTNYSTKPDTPKPDTLPGSFFNEGRALSPMTKAFAEDSDTDFIQILRRGASGCRQLVRCVEERATLSEPLWRAALSVAHVCRDREQAYEAVSLDHPDYDPDKTRDKAARTAGPHSCKQFEMHNPGGCDGCPHLGKLTSPVQLGRVVVEGPPIIEQDEETGEIVQHIMPERYHRGRNGGIWKKAKSAEEEDIHVYDCDIYIIARTKGEQNDMMQVRVYTAQDGVVNFYVPNQQLSNPAELRKVLAGNSVLANDFQFPHLRNYLIDSARMWTKQEKADMLHRQFGWNNDHTAFALVDCAWTAKGKQRIYPHPDIAQVAKQFGEAGTLEKWQEAFNLYGRKGMESFAFGAASTFGAPLLHFSGLSGALISLVSGASGTGKTTVLKMSNSAWGHPSKMLAINDDTYLAKVFKMGYHNSVPLGLDEITNIDPKQLSDLIYNVTHGRGKDRMQQSSNNMRVNDTSWCTIGLTTSNQSIYDTLSVLKSNPQGEIMRIMEYYLDFQPGIIGVAEGDAMFNHQLMENYGHAGPRYAQALVERYAEAKILYFQVIEELRKRLGLKQNERFWVSTAGANLTGVMIAKRLGLIDWDIDALFDWVVQMLRGLRVDVGMPADEDIRLLSELIFACTRHMLVVNGGNDKRSQSYNPLPIHQPKSDTVHVRCEPDTQDIFFFRSQFIKMCNERQINAKELLGKLLKRGICTHASVAKRMTKGTPYDTSPVQAIVFRGDHPDFNLMAAVVDAAVSSAANNEEVYGELEG